MSLDVECLPNYFLIGFKSPESGRTMLFEAYGENTRLSDSDIATIKIIMEVNTTFGFNSNKYDIPMIFYALQGASCIQLHIASIRLIHGEPHWSFMRDMNIILPLFLDHFDVCEPSPAVMISLKAYGTRIGSKRLWEFFVDPMLPIDRATANEIREYNVNDLDVTIDLYNAIKDRIDLRADMSEQYGLDLRSKSDAQIAEAVIVSELFKQGIQAIKPELPDTYTAHYTAPAYIEFTSPQLQTILAEVQTIDFKLAANGSLLMPEALAKKTIKIGNTAYKLGIGGLHSQEKSIAVESNATHVMRNADFASYYPSIIIQNKLFPKHLGYGFVLLLESLLNERLFSKSEQKRLEKIKNELSNNELSEFKRHRLINEGFKIVLNASFGKFGSKYSKLYSPDLLLATTITGQLTLLMLIEQFEAQGISVVSANTDGLEYFCPRDKVELAESLIMCLEFVTGYTMEHDSYLGLYARDVNNYVAKYDGKVKAKGVYAETTLSKGLQTPIVFEAVRKYILDGTALETTIYSCTVVNDFLSSRTVKGGAVWGHDGSPIMDLPTYIEAVAKGAKITKKFTLENEKFRASQVNGKYLGKMVRWYYSTEGQPIYYHTNGNQVAKTGDGVKPMMDLTDTLPPDLNWAWYITEAIEMLKDLGVDYGTKIHV